MSRFLFLVFALLMMAACYGIAGCDEGPKILPSTAPAGPAGTFGIDKPSQVSYNTTMNFSSEGMLRAILHSGRVQQYDIKHYTWLDSSVTVDFYNSTGKHSSVLTSARAKVDMITNNMTAYGHVHIVSDSGTTVDTDSLEWHNKDQTISSDAPVHIVEAGGRTTDGIGFESDQNLDRYRIHRPIIVTPNGSLEGPPLKQQNSLQPETQSVPGAGAFNGQPHVLLVDSAKH